MDERRLKTPMPVWVVTPRFSSEDDVQPGLLYAWVRDVDDRVWRAEVWCTRETAPGVPGPDFRGTRSANNVAPRDREQHWSEYIDGSR